MVQNLGNPHPSCPGCRRTTPLLVEGSDLCIGCDSLIPTRPFPGDDVMVQNLGQPLAYIGGNGHRPVPMATDVGIRPTHKPAQPKPTGLDWSKHGLAAVPDLPHLELVSSQPEPQEVVTVATPSKPSYVDDIVAVMVATDGHPDPAVRAARKVVANALVTLHKTLAGVFPQTSAAADSPTAAAGTPVRAKGRYKRLTPDEVAEVCRRYQAGESTTALGKAFGVSNSTISNKLHAAGIPVRPKAGAS